MFKNMPNGKEKDLEVKSKSTVAKAPKADKAEKAPEIKVDATAGSETTKKESWFNRKLLPFMGKIGNQRHLAAIRDAFGTLIPLIIAGALGVLFTTIVFGGWGSANVSVLGWVFMATHWDAFQDLPDGASITSISDWTDGAWDEISTIGVQIFSPLNAVSLGMMSVYIAFLMGYFIALSRQHKSPILVGMASLAVFGILINFNKFFIDSNGLLVAILGAIAGAELFMVLTNVRALEVKLPDGVPPAVGKSFAVFLPMVFTLIIFSLFNVAIWSIANYSTMWTVDGNNVSTLAVYEASNGVSGLNQIDFTAIVKDVSNADSKQWTITFADSTIVKIDDVEGLTIDIIDEANGVLNAWFGYYDAASDQIAALTGNNEAIDAVITQLFIDMSNVTASDAAMSLAIDQMLIDNNSIAWSSISVNWDHQTAKFTISEDFIAPEAIIVFNYVTVKVPTGSFGTAALIYMLVQAPFMSFVTSDAGIWIALLYVFMVSFLWFFGIHGTNVMNGIFSPVWLGVLAINVDLFISFGNPELAQDAMGTYASSFFDSYLFIGGAGCTLALVAGILVFSNRRELKEISKYAAPAGVFQINEPVTFGFPIVINFVWLVPFIMAPVIILFWASFGVSSGLVYPSYIQTPWTAPFFVGALLSNGLQSPFWSLVFAAGAFLIGFFVYFPFILIDNAMTNSKRRAEGNAAPEEIALWDAKSYSKDAKRHIEADIKAGLVSEDMKAEMLTQAKADQQEMLPFAKIAYAAWREMDKIAYKEKQMQEAKDLAELKAAMAEQAKFQKEEAKKAKMAEKAKIKSAK